MKHREWRNKPTIKIPGTFQAGTRKGNRLRYGKSRFGKKSSRSHSTTARNDGSAQTTRNYSVSASTSTVASVAEHITKHNTGASNTTSNSNTNTTKVSSAAKHQSTANQNTTNTKAQTEPKKNKDKGQPGIQNNQRRNENAKTPKARKLKVKSRTVSTNRSTRNTSEKNASKNSIAAPATRIEASVPVMRGDWYHEQNEKGVTVRRSLRLSVRRTEQQQENENENEAKLNALAERVRAEEAANRGLEDTIRKELKRRKEIAESQKKGPVRRSLRLIAKGINQSNTKQKETAKVKRNEKKVNENAKIAHESSDEDVGATEDEEDSNDGNDNENAEMGSDGGTTADEEDSNEGNDTENAEMGSTEQSDSEDIDDSDQTDESVARSRSKRQARTQRYKNKPKKTTESSNASKDETSEEDSDADDDNDESARENSVHGDVTEKAAYKLFNAVWTSKDPPTKLRCHQALYGIKKGIIPNRKFTDATHGQSNTTNAKTKTKKSKTKKSKSKKANQKAKNEKANCCICGDKEGDDFQGDKTLMSWGTGKFKQKQHKGCRGAVSRMKAKVMKDPAYVLLWKVEFEESENDEEE